MQCVPSSASGPIDGGSCKERIHRRASASGGAVRALSSIPLAHEHDEAREGVAEGDRGETANRRSRLVTRPPLPRLPPPSWPMQASTQRNDAQVGQDGKRERGQRGDSTQGATHRREVPSEADESRGTLQRDPPVGFRAQPSVVEEGRRVRDLEHRPGRPTPAKPRVSHRRPQPRTKSSVK